MPDIKTPSQIVLPSHAGSAPVADVLQRLQVRDPRRKNITAHNRRMEDFEFQWDLSSSLVVGAATFVVAAALMFFPLGQMRIPRISAPVTPATAPVGPSTGRIPRMDMLLSIPRGIHPTPPALRQQPEPEARMPFIPAPQNIRVNPLGPRTLEVRWEGVGDGYRYMLYSATDQSFRDAQAILEQPVPSTHALWMPEDDAPSVWIAVQAFDSEGHETFLSRPVLIQLPRI